MVDNLYTSKAKAEKAASARRQMFRRGFAKAVKNKEKENRVMGS